MLKLGKSSDVNKSQLAMNIVRSSTSCSNAAQLRLIFFNEERTSGGRGNNNENKFEFPYIY